MRPIWSGSISFGLINVPVNLYSASNDIGIDLDMLHKGDKEPIKYMRVCKKDGKEVPYDQIVRGYEVSEGDYVVIDEEDFKRASAKKTSTIDINNFSDEAEIAPHLHEKPYYLEPKKGAEKAFVLLREALRQSKKVGIATFVLRHREHLAALKPEGDAIMLNQLRFESEIREPKGLKLPKGKPRANEMKMAVNLVHELTEKFNPHKFKDTYTERLKKVIKDKAKGKKSVVRDEAPKRSAKVDDMMELLKQSLESGRKPHTAAVKKSKSKSRSRAHASR
jgi:DNA end-binding protein Ku